MISEPHDPISSHLTLCSVLFLAPFLEPDFEYSNPIEDAAVQRILAVRDRTQLAMAPPTAPPPVDVVGWMTSS